MTSPSTASDGDGMRGLRRAQPLRAGGIYKFVHGGEYHMYNPDVVTTLQRAARSGDPRAWQQYCDAVHARPPSALRDLLRPRAAGAPLPLDAVEPAAAILQRFDSAGMSLGALSPEAHEALAEAIGAKKVGDGTVVLTGSNAYGGTTTIADGTLQIGNGGTDATAGAGYQCDLTLQTHGILSFLSLRPGRRAWRRTPRRHPGHGY